MPTFQAHYDVHHLNNALATTDLIEADDQESAEVQAILYWLEFEDGVGVLPPAADVLAAVRQVRARAPKEGDDELISANVIWTSEQGSSYDDDHIMLVIWTTSTAGEIAFGLGGPLVTETDRDADRWLMVTPWVPDPERLAKLSAMGPQELALMVLRLEAIQGP